MKDIAIKHKFDYIVLPSVLSGRDIQELRTLLGADGDNIRILARIDSLDAVQNFTGIAKAADGIIIHRNMLSLELEPEKLMLAQKFMI